MKKILLISAILGLNLIKAQAPATKAVEMNCYNKWAAKFEARGADEVKDGLYDDVIVTIRQGAKATCYRGKAEVRNGIISRFFIMLNDGSYEEVKRTWKNDTDKDVTIVNGISKSMQSVHGELINVLWTNLIRPEKAKPVLAPDPTDD